LGARAEHGSFERFCAAIKAAPIAFRGQRVEYNSPSQGRLSFGWRGPLRQEGAPVALDGFARYDNPYVQAAFPAEQIEARCGEAWLRLDWEQGTRAFSRH
jgi:hypothetical protein